MDSPINMIVEGENILAVLNFISGIALKHGVSEETVKNNHSRLKRLYFPEISPELLDRVRPYLPLFRKAPTSERQPVWLNNHNYAATRLTM